jgi:hypothetical protein
VNALYLNAGTYYGLQTAVTSLTAYSCSVTTALRHCAVTAGTVAAALVVDPSSCLHTDAEAGCRAVTKGQDWVPAHESFRAR